MLKEKGERSALFMAAIVGGLLYLGYAYMAHASQPTAVQLDRYWARLDRASYRADFDSTIGFLKANTLVIGVVLGALTALLADRKNRSVLGWGLAGFFLWFLPILVLAFLSAECPQCRAPAGTCGHHEKAPRRVKTALNRS
ncbi:MAG: hypothetical protein HYY16_17860 [Planctomycetes bacterium]|nr:hypothetical protein [Planctomycetota bacterium]